MVLLRFTLKLRQQAKLRFRTLGLLGTLIIVLLPVGVCAQGQQEPAHIEQDRERIRTFVRGQSTVRSIAQVALSSDGRRLAWSAQDGSSQRITVAPRTDLTSSFAVTAGQTRPCYEGEPQWAPHSNALAFLSDCAVPRQLQVYVVDLAHGEVSRPRQLTKATGSLSHLRWSPSGSQLSFLYVHNASRVPSPMAAESRQIGVIDDRLNSDIQRVAVIGLSSQQLVERTPPKLYAFEYDWSPDSKELVFTAAAPPGDDNWYIAKLYRQPLDSAQPKLVYEPKRQIALPRWSPDGSRIAFIEGLMSDEGGTGGEIFTVAANGQGNLIDLTPDRSSSPSWFTWRPDNTIVFTEFVGGSVAMGALDPKDKTVVRLWQADESIHATGEETSVSIASTSPLTVATVRYSWSALPEVWAGLPASMEQITHLNQASTMPLPRAQNLTWQSDGKDVQGWLLYPSDFDPVKRYPLLVAIHGGPAWIMTPTWHTSDFNTTLFPQFGYFVLFPNPRGSYGQGEAFTIANRRDWGFGDLRDTLRGVDAVLKQQPVDPHRVGLLGWSYGGSTAMFAGTQTDRFRALVAGAGAADWLSYYGQNSIDQWMQPYFGASPYDDPESYARSSAMTYIRHTSTPTLVLVGEHDGEAPPAQSLQFWHALKERHVPTQLRIYADEGHSFFKEEDQIDVTLRALQWFRQYMPQILQNRAN